MQTYSILLLKSFLHPIIPTIFLLFIYTQNRHNDKDISLINNHFHDTQKFMFILKGILPRSKLTIYWSILMFFGIKVVVLSFWIMKKNIYRWLFWLYCAKPWGRQRATPESFLFYICFYMSRYLKVTIKWSKYRQAR